MVDQQSSGEPEPQERHRWAFEFGTGGDLRFISHHDTMRLFRRALVRAGLPVRWSAGFNPHPQITIPLPRPVGIASDVEVLIVTTNQSLEPEDAVERLERETPTDLHMFRSWRLRTGEKMEPVLVRYRVEPADSPIPDIRARARQLLESDKLPVERTNPKKAKRTLVDVRPYLVDINLEDDFVEFALLVTNNGTARPAEIARLLGYQGSAINHRIRRMEIQWR